MTELFSQPEFEKAKRTHDRAQAMLLELAQAAEEASMRCCREAGEGDQHPDLLDLRDRLGALAGDYYRIYGDMRLVRARAGAIQGGGLIRSGGS